LELIYNPKQTPLPMQTGGNSSIIKETFLMTQSQSKIVEKTSSLLEILTDVQYGDFDSSLSVILFKSNRKEYLLKVRLFGNGKRYFFRRLVRKK